MTFDVVIAGGGPAGSTLGCLLRKYDPKIRVLIVERERFPRDHVGESQLPVVCEVLDEMGAWDKVEAADFPIKIGATYRWGRTSDLWDFNFLLSGDFEESPRPGRYSGQRMQTAFQVDRGVYDKILLDHAREAGCTVLEETRIVSATAEGDRITGFRLEPYGLNTRSIEPLPDSTAVGDFYCDCTGGSLLRRAMGIGINSPTSLRNVAVWDYWQNADWAVTIGVGGTRIQVMSLGWGWLWFIPVGKSRTSIGLVTPTQYLKESGKTLEELYRQAIREDPLIAGWIQNAVRENKISTTKDWSFIADRLAGENWFLAGDSAGFADPILSAGLTLAQAGARKLAFTILELRRGELNPVWLHREYESTYKHQIGHHIRFADYWYSANAVFTDLKENCAKIAADAGLSLEAEEAFHWLGTGGFARDVAPGVARAAEWNLGMIKHTVGRFSDKSPKWSIAESNCFRLLLGEAEKEHTARYDRGRVIPTRSLKRGETILPLEGWYGILFDILHRQSDLREIADMLWDICGSKSFGDDPNAGFAQAIEVLEAMIVDGWVEASRNEARPFLQVTPSEEGYKMKFV